VRRVRGVRIEQPSQQRLKLWRALALAGVLVRTPEQLVGVPDNARPAELPDPVDHFSRARPHQGEIAAVNDAVNPSVRDVLDHGVEGGEVPVDVADDGQSHRASFAPMSAAPHAAAGLAGGGGSALDGLARIVGAALLLAVWPWVFHTAVALANGASMGLVGSRRVTNPSSPTSSAVTESGGTAIRQMTAGGALSAWVTAERTTPPWVTATVTAPGPAARSASQAPTRA
jgi:hypothetical protein